MADVLQMGANAPGQMQQQTANAMDQVPNYLQHVQDLQTNKMKQEQLQQQVEAGKFNSFMDMSNNAIGMSDAMWKVAKPAFEKRMQSINPNYMPGTFDSFRTDDNLRQGHHAIMMAKLNGELPTDTKTLQAFNQVIGDPGQLDQIVPSFLEQKKLMAAQQMKEASLANQRYISEQANVTKKEVAQIYGGIRLDKNEAQAVKDVTTDPEVKPIQQTVQQLKKDYDLIQQSRTEGLTPLKAHELVQSYVSALKSMAQKSVGDEREQLQNSATDLETRGNAWLQKISPEGMVKYSDEPFLHDMEENIRGIHGTLKDSLQQRLNEKMRYSGLPSVNNAQQAAYNEMMQGAELGYKPGKKNVAGLMGNVGATPSAPAQAAATQAAQPPNIATQLSATAKAYVQDLIKAGLSETDALARAQKNGVK